MAPSARLRGALAAIDDANGADPTVVTVRDRPGPKEIVHANLVTEWVLRLKPEADDALLLAARGHHFRRWTVPRTSYPAGRAGYLRWRKDLHDQHARELGLLLGDAGYDEETIARVQSIVRKDGLTRAGEHDDVQVLEDALCLVFLETQLVDIAARLDPEKLPGVITKTAAKMSPAGLAMIAEVPLGAGARRILDAAFARDVVQRYLHAMAAGDWTALAATLAPDVQRLGPYGDNFEGRTEYAGFLENIIGSLHGYQLVIADTIVDGNRVAVELNETVDVDDGDARLRTDETVVFDVREGLISRVAVYLQTSERLERVGMTEPVTDLDLARLRRDRVAKLDAAMDAAGVDTLLLCGQQNVSYATGTRVPAADHMRASWWRAVAVLERGAPWPHLYTDFPEGAPAELPDDFLHRAVEVETAAGATALARTLGHGRLAVDDAPFALWDALRGRDLADASTVMAPAKITKTADELECIRRAQAINEEAMRIVRSLAKPGRLPVELSGAFLRAVAELGASANTVDPVFQVMPRSVASGPYSVTDEPVFPIPVGDDALRPDDVLWIDTGINLHGYASDFGATWIVGHAPNEIQREQFTEWRAVVDRALARVKPGATGADLVEAALLEDGRRPWLSYFYLAHGIGTDSAEMPFVGTDLGTAFDASLVLQPGMVLVFEPVIWFDGNAGHRSEEIVAVTNDGYVRLSTPVTLDDGGAA